MLAVAKSFSARIKIVVLVHSLPLAVEAPSLDMEKLNRYFHRGGALYLYTHLNL
jgi:hypothetical protein